MPMLNDLQQELANLRAEGDAAAHEARTLKFRAQALRTRLARVQRSAPPEGDQLSGLEHEIADLDAAANAARERSRVIDDAMRDRAIDLLQVPVDDLVAQLPQLPPRLLLPGRLGHT